MSDAWIITAHDEEAAATARAVAELGFRPLRVDVDGGISVREGDATTRAPAVAIVLGDSACVTALRQSDDFQDVPVVLSLSSEQLATADPALEVDELIVAPFGAEELRARIGRARKQVNGINADDVVRIGTLEIDLATYEVSIAGRTIDFTYMEYELLRFLATHPGRVYTREALLSRVWGYDYFGGARTVDVHVRRVRAKLGTDHAHRVKTVRSVGYRFEA
ncbi:MAG: response regulator with CheY-like receiver domain and winged-helix DNA-binding domain [Solirubrobacterales bacterium]|nr:response regulator with CheY-like receiver domain and winged-helix DNA-binding domain [Solirubrobacterales bacterium]